MYTNIANYFAQIASKLTISNNMQYKTFVQICILSTVKVLPIIPFLNSKSLHVKDANHINRTQDQPNKPGRSYNFSNTLCINMCTAHRYTHTTALVCLLHTYFQQFLINNKYKSRWCDVKKLCLHPHHQPAIPHKHSHTHARLSIYRSYSISIKPTHSFRDYYYVYNLLHILESIKRYRKYITLLLPTSANSSLLRFGLLKTAPAKWQKEEATKKEEKEKK